MKTWISGLISIGLSAHVAAQPAPGSPFAAIEKAAMAEPFRGITADGAPIPGLFPLTSTGVATDTVRTAAEAFIATLTAHFAHHALTNADGIGHYRGNFGNLLSLWDVLFGTALITRRYPAAVGLIDDRRQGQEKWYVQLLFPVFRSRRSETVLAGELPPRAIPES